jgi:uncharacterized membrane protein
MTGVFLRRKASSNVERLDQLWNDPVHWNRDGSYKCAADPRLLVRARRGVGLTLNMSHPRANFAMLLIVVFVVCILGGVIALATRGT